MSIRRVHDNNKQIRMFVMRWKCEGCVMRRYTVSGEVRTAVVLYECVKTIKVF